MKPFPNTNTNTKLQFSLTNVLPFSLIALIAFVSLFALFATSPTNNSPRRSGISSNTLNKKVVSAPAVGPLPPLVSETLINLAISTNSTQKMPEPDVRAIAGVLARKGPCNLLVFGLGPETALWRALNLGGRTVFIDESEYDVQRLESQSPPGLEAYDVSYTTKASELPELLAGAREQVAGECRPVQRLLFSECRLAINDLPNELYDLDWDVILVDGPKGFSGSSPGRMTSIFTAGVMARSGEVGKEVDVFVHDFGREVERVCSEEFLCAENLVMRTESVGHFLLKAGGRRDGRFCAGNE